PASSRLHPRRGLHYGTEDVQRTPTGFEGEGVGIGADGCVERGHPSVLVERRLRDDVLMHGGDTVFELIARPEIHTFAALPEAAAAQLPIVELMQPGHPHALQVPGDGEFGVHLFWRPIRE